MDSDHKEKAKSQENHTMETRGKKRLDILKKNRKNGLSTANTPTDEIKTENIALIQSQKLLSIEPATREIVEKMYQTNFKIEQFNDLVEALNSQDVLQQHHGCIGIRKLLLNEDNTPIQIVIDAKCVPRFIEFIKQTTYPTLQLEAEWCLTNISSGTTQQIKSIINKGAIPLFCRLLTSRFSKISELAIKAIGNMAGDCSIYRDMILKSDGLKPLANILLNTQDKAIIKDCSWALSNLCRGRPLAKFELIKEAIPPLSKVFQMETDPEVLREIAWAFSYLSDGNEDRIQLLVDTDIIPSLIKHINHQQLSILHPCLITIGNICAGSDSQKDAVLARGVLPEIFKQVKNENKSVRRESCWVLSNIATGNSQQISLIVNDNSYIESLFQCILSDLEEVSREAIYVIVFCTLKANFQEKLRLVDLNLLEIYIHLLKTSQDQKIIALILESLYNILEGSKKEYKKEQIISITYQLESLGAKKIFKNLQRHHDNYIQETSLFLLKNFFEIIVL